MRCLTQKLGRTPNNQHRERTDRFQLKHFNAQGQEFLSLNNIDWNVTIFIPK